jgi:4-aminobutyrate aminotransferase-like enzyme
MNSGSETNDTAIRIARKVTEGTEVICLQGAYHGHTEIVLHVSPYKYEGHGVKIFILKNYYK